MMTSKEKSHDFVEEPLLKVEGEEDVSIKLEGEEFAIKVAAANINSNIMATSKSYEPPTFVSETKSYAAYKKDLYMWSRIANVPKKNQAEIVVYNLDGHPSRIKEKIVVNIGDKIQDAEDGIEQLIKFLDTIYQEDDMADAWFKYKNFQKISRTDSMTINNFIAEFEKEYILAKSAGCVYSDILLAFRLLEATKLSEMDEKFVLTGVDYAVAKTNKKLFDQVKTSLKKFQGRKVIGEEQRIRYDPALVSSIAQTLIAQGWKKPTTVRRRSNTDPGDSQRNSPFYKGKKNPLGREGKPLTCFKCSSVYHFQDKCPKKNEESRLRADAKEYGMIAITDNNNMKGMQNPFDEIVMVADTEEQLCLMVKEAGERGVIDSACSKTVAGTRFVLNYISKLPKNLQDCINNGEPSKTVYQFGGGEQRTSHRKIGLPAMIGSMKLTILTEIVDADIPLLIGVNSLEVSKAVLDFGGMKAKNFDTEVPLTKVGSGHFCISLLPNLNHLQSTTSSTIYQDMQEETVLHSIEITKDLTYKELQKLHHICGHTSTDRLMKLIARADKVTKSTKKDLIKIKESCEACQKNSKATPRPKFAIPRADRFNQIVTIDLKDYDQNDPQRRYICYLIDMHTRLLTAKFIPEKQPCRIVETILEKWIGVGYGVMGALHTDLGGEFSNKELADVASKLGIHLTTTASYSPHQNGINERNHHTVDVMMKKMLDSDKSLTPDSALYWSINAKNSLENCYGFSPYQLVFATNPQFPSATQCGPPDTEISS